MDDSAAQMTELMRTLGARLIERTRGEIVTMRKQAEHLRAGDREVAMKFRHWAHRLHGTGASLGMAPISHRGGQMERLLVEALGSEGALDARTGEAVLEHVDRLEEDLKKLEAPR
jgi:chemotaxis protein histidine kinase CheA